MSETINSYGDLRVWQDAMVLAESCYAVTRSFPREEMFGLTSQIRRAATSIAANIAEDDGREHRGAFIQFLRIAWQAPPPRSDSGAEEVDCGAKRRKTEGAHPKHRVCGRPLHPPPLLRSFGGLIRKPAEAFGEGWPPSAFPSPTPLRSVEEEPLATHHTLLEAPP